MATFLETSAVSVAAGYDHFRYCSHASGSMDYIVRYLPVCHNKCYIIIENKCNCRHIFVVSDNNIHFSFIGYNKII